MSVVMPIHCKDTLALGSDEGTICAINDGTCTFHRVSFDSDAKNVILKFVSSISMIPRIIACDTHPGYNSVALAGELANHYRAKLVSIQHHMAHVASVAAEHSLREYVGIAMDGLGYGEDGNIWGGEVFYVKGRDFERIGHLEYQPMIGGDSATVHPKKMLFGILSRFLSEKELIRSGFFRESEAGVYLKMLGSDFNVALSSSSGRVLDAAAALLGLSDHYSQVPPVLLERAATVPYDFMPVLKNEKGKAVLLTTPLFEFLWKNREKDVGMLAATAQIYIAKGLFEVAKKRKRQIVLSGGVANNKAIAGFMAERGVLLNRKIPCGDAGICFGQAYLANLC